MNRSREREREKRLYYNLIFVVVVIAQKVNK